MANSNNKQSAGFISNAFGVAKKLSRTSIKILNRIAQEGSTADRPAAQNPQRIAKQTASGAVAHQTGHTTPQQLLRQHMPQVSRQLLGRYYYPVNRVKTVVAPELTEQISDYLFEKLNQISARYSSVDAVLNEAGAQDLEELTQDIQRCNRVSQALAEQNKWLAALQGAVTGTSGAVGSAIDVPISIAFALRTIYQTGRAYGFSLSQASEQEIVHYIFKQVNLGLIAEKQTVLVGLKAVTGLLQRHGQESSQQLQRFLGANQEAETLKKWLFPEDEPQRDQWLNKMPKVALVSKLSPLAAAGIGAFYSWKFMEEAGQKAQTVFSSTRQYLNQYQDSSLSPLAAYEASLRLLSKKSPLLPLASSANLAAQRDQDQIDPEPQSLTSGQNPAISKITIQKKEVPVVNRASKEDEQVAQGVSQLAAQHVEPHAPVAPQKTAVPVLEEEQLEDFDLAPNESESTGQINATEEATPGSSQTQNQTVSNPGKQQH